MSGVVLPVEVESRPGEKEPQSEERRDEKETQRKD
jgi:hypothetical protein